VRLAQHPIFEQGKLLAGRQLATAGITGKAGKMEDEVARPAHPVRGGYGAATFGTFCTKISAGKLRIVKPHQIRMKKKKLF
jgi:hypothetical protein